MESKQAWMSSPTRETGVGEDDHCGAREKERLFQRGTNDGFQDYLENESVNLFSIL
jgi:hypothetical protein